MKIPIIIIPINGIRYNRMGYNNKAIIHNNVIGRALNANIRKMIVSAAHKAVSYPNI